MFRFQVNIVGESGSGLLSTGEILMNALHDIGFYVYADREFPSLIKGGYSCFSVVISDEKVRSYNEKCDVMVGLDKQGMEEFAHRIKKNGVLIHGYERLEGIADLTLDLIKNKEVDVKNVSARKLAKEVGGNILMSNVVILGVLWKVLGLDIASLQAAVKVKFASKPKLLEIDLKALENGYNSMEVVDELKSIFDKVEHEVSRKKENVLMDGNKSLALGAVLADCKTYYAYPMSPSSSILSYLSEWSPQTGMMVKQAEDEITAVQMNIGSSYAGTRALTATSGGGFDLMTESLSLAAMIEVPLVLIDVQRPGPATGLPTWTAQGDVDLLKYAGHGEYTRLVMSVSAADDAAVLVQKAFNLSEEFQIPVLVMSEKVIADSIQTVERDLFEQIEIERHLTDANDDLVSQMRYVVNESGVSPRWIPASNSIPYFANGDEHFIDGRLTEDAEKSAMMIDKRCRKESVLLDAIPEPEIYGGADYDLIVVGFGSVRMVMEDVVDYFRARGIKLSYLHFTYLFPLKIEVLTEVYQSGAKLLSVEGNRNGQFGSALEDKMRNKIFSDKFLKYDGRPFYFDEVKEFIESNLKKR
jgi:2-oxoglutarate ferredoxin oxidoreductase subunit alpha